MGFLDAQAVGEKLTAPERMEVEPKLDVGKPFPCRLIFIRCRLDELAVAIVVLRWKAVLNLDAEIVAYAFDPIVSVLAVVALKDLAVPLEAETFLGAQELGFVRPPRVAVSRYDFSSLRDRTLIIA